MPRSKAELKKLIAEKQKDIDTMHRIMSNCYSDEGYRGYSRSLTQFTREKLALEKEMEALHDPRN